MTKENEFEKKIEEFHKYCEENKIQFIGALIDPKTGSEATLIAAQKSAALALITEQIIGISQAIGKKPEQTAKEIKNMIKIIEKTHEIHRRK